MPNNEVLPLQTAEQEYENKTIIYVWCEGRKESISPLFGQFYNKNNRIDRSNSKVTLPFEDHWGEENCLLVVDSCLCATNLYFVM